MSCSRASVALDNPVAVESSCWMIFQQGFFCFVGLIVSLCMGRILGNLCYSIYLQNNSLQFAMQTCSCYLVWTILLVGDGHPSWTLEVTGNSGFFKLVYCRNFVAVISSNPCALCAGGNTVLSISRLGWAQPTPNLLDDTESGCISIQSNVCQTYRKV